jgi:hypothetical protein
MARPRLTLRPRLMMTLRKIFRFWSDVSRPLASLQTYVGTDSFSLSILGASHLRPTDSRAPLNARKPRLTAR